MREESDKLDVPILHELLLRDVLGIGEEAVRTEKIFVTFAVWIRQSKPLARRRAGCFSAAADRCGRCRRGYRLAAA